MPAAKRKTPVRRSTRRTTVRKQKTNNRFANLKPKQKALAILSILVIAVLGASWLLMTRAATVDQYTSAGIATAGLDPTGKTLPSFDYPVPTSGRVVYMAPADKGGNDANDGLTLEKPVATITRAYNQLKSGGNASGTIVLRGGEYRSWYSGENGTIAGTMSGGNITFQAYRSEKPWFVGTDPVKDGWVQASSGVWKRKWSTPNFCTSHLSGKDASGARTNYRTKVPRLDGAMVAPITAGMQSDNTGISMSAPRVCAHPDTYYTRTDRPYAVDTDPQLVVSGGAQLPQKKTLAELASSPNSFYYDWANEEIYVNKDPNANTLELSKRHALTLFGGAHKFQWKGIGVKHFASSPLHSVIYAGLGGSGSPNSGEFIVENSVFTENSGATIDISGPKLGTGIKRSVFASNGYAGYGSNGYASSNPGAPNSLTIDASIFNDNNKSNLDSACTASCGAAGVKLNNMAGYTVKNSIFENTNVRSPGLWCDIDCSKGVMVNNIVRNNGGYGIFYEISSKGIIANNLVYDNNFAGIAVFAASTKVFNNTIINKVGSNVQAFWIMDDDRPAPDKGETWPYTVAAMQAAHSSLGVGYAVRVGPNTNGVEFANNLVVGQPVAGGARLNNFGNNRKPTAPNTTSKDYFNRIDYNAYYHISGQSLYSFGSTDNIKTPQDFRTASQRPDFDVNAIQVTGSTTPDPFVDRGRQDFRLKTTSEAFTKKGMALPADVAVAMGVPAGATLSRGFQFATTSTTPVPDPDPTPDPEPVTPASIQLSGLTNGATVQSTLNVEAKLTNAPNIQRVRFFIDNTEVASEGSAPYCMGGDSGGVCNSFSLANIADGDHTLKVSALYGTSQTVEASLQFKKTSPTPPPPPPPAEDTQAPSTPVGLTRTLTANWGKLRYDLNLTWQPSADNVGVQEYVITRNGQPLGTSPNPAYTDSSLKAGTLYTYNIFAKDAKGNTSGPAITTAKANCFWFICSLE